MLLDNSTQIFIASYAWVSYTVVCLPARIWPWNETSKHDLLSSTVIRACLELTDPHENLFVWTVQLYFLMMPLFLNERERDGKRDWEKGILGDTEEGGLLFEAHQARTHLFLLIRITHRPTNVCMHTHHTHTHSQTHSGSIDHNIDKNHKLMRQRTRIQMKRHISLSLISR